MEDPLLVRLRQQVVFDDSTNNFGGAKTPGGTEHKNENKDRNISFLHS